MFLFNSYSIANVAYCDITNECSYPDPISRIRCIEVENICGDLCSKLIVENGLLLCDCADQWNCNLCGTDLPFWIPFEAGDTFDFQFQQPNEITQVSCENAFLPEALLSTEDASFATFGIYSCCDDQALEITKEMIDAIVVQSYIGSFNSYDYAGNLSVKPIQMIRFRLDAIAAFLEAQGLDQCFYFKFTFTGSRLCLPFSETQSTFCSEPFKMIPCSDGKKSHLIESTYSFLDCFGQYYGNDFNLAQGIPFTFSNAIRVHGSFEQTAFQITKEQIDSTLKTTASQLCETWLLRTKHLPQRFAKYLATVLAGKDVTINGVEYQVEGELNRNNETGSQFYFDVNAQRCDCNKSLSCT